MRRPGTPTFVLSLWIRIPYRSSSLGQFEATLNWCQLLEFWIKDRAEMHSGGTGTCSRPSKACSSAHPLMTPRSRCSGDGARSDHSRGQSWVSESRRLDGRPGLSRGEDRTRFGDDLAGGGATPEGQEVGGGLRDDLRAGISCPWVSLICAAR